MILITTIFLTFLSIRLKPAAAFAASGSKKILLSFDGTGNNARDFEPKFDEKEKIDQSITNVLKLHLLAGGDINNRRNDVDGQICIYKRGVGGESDNKIVANLNVLKGELSQQTIPMREMLEKVYEKGDKLYIIGYSRGAASARQFISELSENGLITASGEKVEKPPVEFLGCFETVSMQIKQNFFNIMRTKRLRKITKASVIGEIGGKISSIVNRAVHNVALDDNRFTSRIYSTFPPVFMDSKDERVQEAWFSGEHGDVGGTYYTKGMSDFSCKHMQEWMEHYGISFIKPEDINSECLDIDEYPEVKINKMDLDIKPNPKDKLHLNESQIKKPSFRPVVAVTNEKIIKGGKVKIHRSVLDHMVEMKENNTPYKINPEIMKSNIVVVGSLNKELESETKLFKELLAELK